MLVRVSFVGGFTGALFVVGSEEAIEETLLEESFPLVLLPSPSVTTSVTKLESGSFFCFLELGSKKDEAVGVIFFFLVVILLEVRLLLDSFVFGRFNVGLLFCLKKSVNIAIKFSGFNVF